MYKLLKHADITQIDTHPEPPRKKLSIQRPAPSTFQISSPIGKLFQSVRVNWFHVHRREATTASCLKNHPLPSRPLDPWHDCSGNLPRIQAIRIYKYIGKPDLNRAWCRHEHKRPSLTAKQRPTVHRYERIPIESANTLTFIEMYHEPYAAPNV